MMVFTMVILIHYVQNGISVRGSGEFFADSPHEQAKMCGMLYKYVWFIITAIFSVITVSRLFFFISCLPFYLLACLTCFAIIGNNELVSCPKFYCLTGVQPLSALEQRALRFSLIDYNIHFGVH
jgi:hypothetical protein